MVFLKRIKKSKTQQSLAVIIARRNSELVQLPKMEELLIEGLIKTEISPYEEHIIWFYIHLVEQLARIEDQNSPRRVQFVII